MKKTNNELKKAIKQFFKKNTSLTFYELLREEDLLDDILWHAENIDNLCVGREEYDNIFNSSGENFKRILCDIARVGYHTPTEEIFNKLKNKL